MVKVQDLQDQTGHPGPHAILHCAFCDAEYSANRADYFNMASDEVFTCECGEELELVRKVTNYINL